MIGSDILIYREAHESAEVGLIGARNMFVVVRGSGLPIALEAALKFKETCGVHAEAFSAAEVKHGPMALVGPGFSGGVFRPGRRHPDKHNGCGERIPRPRRQRLRGRPGQLGSGALSVPVGLPAQCTPLLIIQSLYRATSELALRRGFNPDGPPNLNKITETV